MKEFMGWVADESVDLIRAGYTPEEFIAHMSKLDVKLKRVDLIVPEEAYNDLISGEASSVGAIISVDMRLGETNTLKIRVPE